VPESSTREGHAARVVDEGPEVRAGKVLNHQTDNQMI
jgi:hypothetical protein